MSVILSGLRLRTGCFFLESFGIQAATRLTLIRHQKRNCDFHYSYIFEVVFVQAV